MAETLSPSSAIVPLMASPTAAGRPTPYPELNAVLDHLLAGVRAALGSDLVGVYLQGSFAVGDFTPYSDCDFVVVVRRDLTPAQLTAVRALHAGIPDLPHPYWSTGLEGSYAPAGILRRWSTEPRDPPGEPRSDDWADPGLAGAPPLAYPFWYIDHGSRAVVRSEHDNNQVVRWCLRERGVVLTGPDPRTLIDPVPPEALKVEVRLTLDRSQATGLPMPMVAWQAFWVGLFCRILHTLETGEVTSKPAALRWARQTLDPAWADLIAHAQALKKGDDATAALPADPTLAAATRAFGAYARAWADR